MNLLKKYKREHRLEVDVEYPKELYENHNELPFLVERMKIGRMGGAGGGISTKSQGYHAEYQVKER